MGKNTTIEDVQIRMKQISYSIRLTKMISNSILKKSGVNIGFDQLLILFYAYSDSNINQQQIANSLLRDKSSVLRSVQSLILKGLISTSEDEFDARKKILHLTASGITVVNKIVGMLPKFDEI